ncbi:hypothetical protein N7528_002576 [Penicillium herquei]|nr:hypothetical protein N7528_002576 [Penicillium herquei]
MSRNFLITAASGNIGRELLPMLQTLEGARVILPTSNADRLQKALPPPVDGASAEFIVEEGSIRDPSWLQQQLIKYEVDTVFLCLTGQDELFTTMNILDCLARSKVVKHLVYISACIDFTTPRGVQELLGHCSAGHILVKIITEQKLLYGNLPYTWTILRPSLFFSNDLRTKRSMMGANMYSEPIGEKGVSRVAPSDIALAAKNSMVNNERWANKHVCVGTKKIYKGSEIAGLWSKAIGKDIKMLPITEEGFENFEKRIIPFTGPEQGRELRLMVEAFSSRKLEMSSEEYQDQVELLGKEPECYEAWIQQVGASWQE